MGMSCRFVFYVHSIWTFFSSQHHPSSATTTPTPNTHTRGTLWESLLSSPHWLIRYWWHVDPDTFITLNQSFMCESDRLLPFLKKFQATAREEWVLSLPLSLTNHERLSLLTLKGLLIFFFLWQVFSSRLPPLPLPTHTHKSLFLWREELQGWPWWGSWRSSPKAASIGHYSTGNGKLSIVLV